MTFKPPASNTRSPLTTCPVRPPSLPHVDTDQIMPKQFLKGIDRKACRRVFCTTCVLTQRAKYAPILC
jgi:hypothetical protein